MSRSSRNEGSGRTALVTGASAGIGAALARVFAEHGFDLVLTARRLDRLETLAGDLRARFGVRAMPLAADLADPEAPQRLFDEVARRGIVVDALVNNAGYGVPGRLASSDWATHRSFIEVMVTAVVHLSHLFERGMTERGYGRILNVASIAGLAPGATGPTLYAAAKAFVVTFSKSIALEHLDDGVRVCALCPGPTETEFFDVLGNPPVVNALPSWLWMDAETVARQGYDAVMRGRVVCVPGALNRIALAIAKLAPEAVVQFVMRWQEKKFRTGKSIDRTAPDGAVARNSFRRDSNGKRSESIAPIRG